MMKQASILIALCVAPPTTLTAEGAVTIYTNKSNWQNNVGTSSAITFAEFGVPTGTWLKEQYSSLGVHFTDGSDQFYNNTNIFADGWGLNGALNESTIGFDSPVTTIALDFPGTVQVELYLKGQLLYTSPLLGSTPTGNFRGLVSTDPFDKVILDDPLSGLVIDNLYFGPPIPAPGALAIFAASALLGKSRRRKSAQ
jgi:hypothetical protein